MVKPKIPLQAQEVNVEAENVNVVATAAEPERRIGAPGPRDTTVIVKSAETIEADKVARAAEITAAELRTASQRRVNLLWECTQASIAVAVVVANLVAALGIFPAKDGNNILPSAFFLIVGFYFGRTNHQTTGGTGTQTPLHQTGR